MQSLKFFEIGHITSDGKPKFTSNYMGGFIRAENGKPFLTAAKIKNIGEPHEDDLEKLNLLLHDRIRSLIAVLGEVKLLSQA